MLARTLIILWSAVIVASVSSQGIVSTKSNNSIEFPTVAPAPPTFASLDYNLASDVGVSGDEDPRVSNWWRIWTRRRRSIRSFTTTKVRPTTTSVNHMISPKPTSSRLAQSSTVLPKPQTITRARPIIISTSRSVTTTMRFTPAISSTTRRPTTTTKRTPTTLPLATFKPSITIRSQVTSANLARRSSSVLATAAVPVPTLTPLPSCADCTSTWRIMAEKIVSLFENGVTDLVYNYCENIGDGRGITAGYRGFTTATSDAKMVVDLYTKYKGPNVMTKYSTLLGKNNNDISGYCQDWVIASNDLLFQRVQREIVDIEYFKPAMSIAAQSNVVSPLGKLVLYDSYIQHGEGDDQWTKGVVSMVSTTKAKVGTADEKLFIKTFLAVRKAVLLSGDRVSKDSAPRCDDLLKLANDNNWNISPPLILTGYYTGKVV